MCHTPLMKNGTEKGISTLLTFLKHFAYIVVQLLCHRVHSLAVDRRLRRCGLCVWVVGVGCGRDVLQAWATVILGSAVSDRERGIRVWRRRIRR